MTPLLFHTFLYPLLFIYYFQRLSWISFFFSGSYQDSTNQHSCKLCPPGFYCDPTSLSPGQGIIQPVNCTAGYYCPQNTSTALQYACPPGTFGSVEGLEKDGDCTPCPGGSYCTGNGETTVSGVCSSGFYCTLSSSTPEPTNGIVGDVCPKGKYCPENSKEGQDCPKGRDCLILYFTHIDILQWMKGRVKHSSGY